MVTIVFLSGNHTISIHTSDQGTAGTKLVCIKPHYYQLLQLQITVQPWYQPHLMEGAVQNTQAQTNTTAASGEIVSFAAETSADAWDLSDVSMGLLKKHLKMLHFYEHKMVVECPG